MITFIKRYKKKFSQYHGILNRGKSRQKNPLQINSIYHNFTLENIKQYQDFKITHYTFKNKLGIIYHHLDCDSIINTLSITINTGLPTKPAINYALQTLLQCGSKQYPVNNIIKQMLKRSLNRIDNTFIQDQYLMYIFQTNNKIDYQNLFKVYTSMIINSILSKQSYNQQIINIKQQKDKLLITGNLYNKMQQLNQYIQNKLYQIINKQLLGRQYISICYPQELIQLKYNHILQFYQRVISFNNFIIISHGDFDPVWNLELIEKFILQNQILKTKNLKAVNLPKTIEITHLQLQSPLILSYKIPENTPSSDRVILSILSYLLFDMPDSPFMIWNTPQTPYPKLYGYRNQYFNIGITTREKLTRSELLQKQIQIQKYLKNLYQNKISNNLIQSCLMHLQGSYYQNTGLKIIQSSIINLLKGQNLDQILNVRQIITNLLKKYRKQNIFQEILKKYIIDNTLFLRIYGRYNNYLIEDQIYNRNNKIQQIKLFNPQLLQISKNQHQSSVSLQNPNILPTLNLKQIQLIENLQPISEQIQGIKILYQNKPNKVSLLLKFDMTDIDQQLFNLLKIYCQLFPKLGSKNLKKDLYYQQLNNNIDILQMNFETNQQNINELKIYFYLKIQFTQRNIQIGFNFLNQILNNLYYDSLELISKNIQILASKTYNQISQKIIYYHSLYLASSKSAYNKIQDPLFHARSICSLASNILKVGNPKLQIQNISRNLYKINKQMRQKHRIQGLLCCDISRKQVYKRYLSMIFSQLQHKQTLIPAINIDNFQQENWMKYLPHSNKEVVFQAFTVPCQEKFQPSLMILSSIIDQNIRLFNKVGGCFLYKGALVSYLGGNRKKFLQLQDYYKKLENIDQIKIFLINKLNNKITQQKLFKINKTYKQLTNKKQLILNTKKQQLQKILQQYILQKIKKQQSSLLILGNHLENYQPLIKKGWEIQRSIDQISLKVLENNQNIDDCRQFIQL